MWYVMFVCVGWLFDGVLFVGVDVEFCLVEFE